MALWNCQQRSQEVKEQPGKETLHNPIALPTPRFDAVDGNVAAGLAEGADCNNKKSDKYFHFFLF
jgi:hypothetical protein